MASKDLFLSLIVMLSPAMLNIRLWKQRLWVASLRLTRDNHWLTIRNMTNPVANPRTQKRTMNFMASFSALS